MTGVKAEVILAIKQWIEKVVGYFETRLHYLKNLHTSEIYQYNMHVNIYIYILSNLFVDLRVFKSIYIIIYQHYSFFMLFSSPHYQIVMDKMRTPKKKKESNHLP